MKRLLVLLTPLILWASEPFFTTFEPPKGWIISDPAHYEKGVQIGYIQSNKKVFTPSITLAYEKVGNADLETYVKAVRKNFEMDRHNRFQELGTLRTESGDGVLIQVDIKKRFGEIRLLQAISLHHETAIIHTATCPKEEFLKVHENLLNSFKSLTIFPSVSSSCSDPSLKERIDGMFKCWKKYRSTSKDSNENLFASSFFQNNQWKPFVNYVEKELNSQGSCWQILAINHLKETLLTENDR